MELNQDVTQLNTFFKYIQDLQIALITINGQKSKGKN